MWIAKSGVMSAPLGDEIALLDGATDTYFTLNPTAAVLWHRLQSPADLAALTAALAAEFDVSAEDCAADVEAVLATLSDLALIRPVAAAPAD